MAFQNYEKCTKCKRPNCNGNPHLDDGDGYLGCTHCGIELNDVIDLITNPTSRDQATCEICDLAYTTPDHRQSHFISHFVGSDATGVLCIQCQSESEAHHKADEFVVDVPGTKYFPCDVCKEDNFASAKELKRHKLEEHGIEVKERFSCRNCSEEFDTANKLNYHRNRRHPRPQKAEYPCRVCGEELFKTQAERRHHENERHRDAETRQWPCTFCDKCFTNVSMLEFHLLKHTNKKSHTCDVCGKSFGRLAHMEYHRLSHTDQKLFECVLCMDKSFKTAHSLQRHIIRMHSEKPGYPCEQCGKVFKDSSDRRRHRWTHGGFEKKFECEICAKKFFENKALRFHMRTHAKEEQGSPAAAGYILEDSEETQNDTDSFKIDNYK